MGVKQAKKNILKKSTVNVKEEDYKDVKKRKKSGNNQKRTIGKTKSKKESLK